MRWRSWSVVFLGGLAWAIGTPQAHAQSVVGTRPLGGYGATSGNPMASMGSSGPMIPYAGSFGGFMPYRMSSGRGGELSFSPRGSTLMESSRSSFSLAPMSGGMRAGMGARTGVLDSARTPGVELMRQPMIGGSNTSVMPPNFGYPFYQPPSLLSPASSVSGMSM